MSRVYTPDAPRGYTPQDDPRQNRANISIPNVLPLTSQTKYDAVTHTGCCSRTLRRAIARGELQAMRIGKAIRIRTIDLDAWLDSKVIGTPKRMP